MALTMSVSEASASLAAILDRVVEGDEITITRNGRAVAVVIRPDRLRFRRGAPALEEAERLRERMEDARRRPLSSTNGLAPGRAEELVAQIRADRDADPLPGG
ncbi:MAG: type II toxin-antitoxin system Phd/YefM family antitoxin [Acidimicrobiales bacterium]|nr:type II toxin-antitoxin system Phd/YefM family antitoxin [Acidimicrobiales bacterium]